VPLLLTPQFLDTEYRLPNFLLLTFHSFAKWLTKLDDEYSVGERKENKKSFRSVV
jgi:hypothetical protein